MVVNELNEIKSAQKSIYEGGQILCHAGLHLRGTKYEKAWDRLWTSLGNLNKRLIRDINKK